MPGGTNVQECSISSLFYVLMEKKMTGEVSCLFSASTAEKTMRRRKPSYSPSPVPPARAHTKQRSVRFPLFPNQDVLHVSSSTLHNSFILHQICWPDNRPFIVCFGRAKKNLFGSAIGNIARYSNRQEDHCKQNDLESKPNALVHIIFCFHSHSACSFPACANHFSAVCGSSPDE